MPVVNSASTLSLCSSVVGAKDTNSCSTSLGWQPPVCYLNLAILGVLKGRTIQSSYIAHYILGTGNKCTICGGKRPKKVKIGTKMGGGKVYRGIRYIKDACVYEHDIACVPR